LFQFPDTNNFVTDIVTAVRDMPRPFAAINVPSFLLGTPCTPNKLQRQGEWQRSRIEPRPMQYLRDRDEPMRKGFEAEEQICPRRLTGATVIIIISILNKKKSNV